MSSVYHFFTLIQMRRCLLALVVLLRLGDVLRELPQKEFVSNSASSVAEKVYPRLCLTAGALRHAVTKRTVTHRPVSNVHHVHI